VQHTQELQTGDLLEKPNEKIQPERRRHLWENNIKMDLKDTNLEGVDWIGLVQDRDR
jgi:hypothetical protein